MPVSVILPAYNEEEAVARTVGELRQVLERSAVTMWEIIVVDDGSTDATSRMAEEAGARVIRHLQRLGYGKALKDGIDATKYDAVAIMDADRTYPPDRLPDLLAKFHEGYHMVVGQRLGCHVQDSAVKAPLRWLLKWLVEFTTGSKIPDVNSGFRIFDRREARSYFPRLCDTFSFTTSLTLAYMMNKRFVAYVPVEYRARTGKSKVMLIRDSLRTLQYIVQAVLYYNPIKIFLALAGGAVVFAGACLALGFLFDAGATALLLAAGVLSAILIFALGLLADLLRQIMLKQ